MFFSLNVSLAGEKIGNGGDVRRLRAHQSQLVAWNILGSTRLACEPLLESESGWLKENASALGQELLRTRREWLDPEAGEPAPGVCVRYVRENAASAKFVFSYPDCPPRSERGYYTREIIRAFFAARTSEHRLLQKRIDAFFELHRVAKRCADAQGLGENPFVYREIEIAPESFTNATAMNHHWEKVRRELAAKIRKLNPRDLRDIYGDEPGSRGRFLIDHRDALASEVEGLRAHWGSEARSCGFTEPVRGAPIEISLADCRELKTERDLAWLLMHETTHHFGVEDEIFADEIATLLTGLGGGHLNLH